MASQDEPARNGPRAENFKLRPRGGPINQEGEEAEKVCFPSPGLISLNKGSRGLGKAELQGIFRSFCSWLQPDTHSKQQMIVQLSVEQFLLNRPSSERAAWREKWESSGRDLEAFMEHLGDEDLRPPSLVHVRMGEQEALFSENMPSGQILAHLQEQRSAAAATALTPGTPSPTPPETPRPAAPGDADADGRNLSSPDHQPPFRLTLEEESPQRPAEGKVSGESPRSSGSASPGAPTAQEEPPREEAPREAGGARKLYRCDRCPQVFEYLCRFQLHQRRHNNERPFVCATCGKGFFQASELRVHELIHAEEKPFRCGRCDRAFSHQTNLRAHERIHTGAKPYACAQCGRTYRQSSTYHRHLRMHQRKASESGASSSLK
ncbi:zinc finger and SCAN domain-containing protein 4-like [Myotis yumanensis]|uniref:zinc finger and SCAN domain-containing protein 4-like n=1 Tax=Myotis yumanensis TaxID=159337 RepID=UPI0038D1116A